MVIPKFFISSNINISTFYSFIPVHFIRIPVKKGCDLTLYSFSVVVFANIQNGGHWPRVPVLQQKVCVDEKNRGIVQTCAAILKQLII